MAVAAVQRELLGVNRMGKGHRLKRLISDACVFWRAVIPHPRRHCSSNQHRSHGDLERKPVRPLWENVRHLYSLPTGSQATEIQATVPVSGLNASLRSRESVIVANSPPASTFLSPTKSRPDDRQNQKHPDH